jgi:glutamate synthase domain-containing protein 3
MSSIHSAGVPWELGIAETQQTLVRERLRDRVVLQVDGGMKTGRDVVVAALLGAEEFGFSTAPLIALGCIMMRVCHLNTCPVGIATQDPELRERFDGVPEHVTRYLLLVADDVRRHMSLLGIGRFDELVGRADLLDGGTPEAAAHGLDLSDLVAREEGPRLRTDEAPRPVDPEPLDAALLEAAQPAVEHGRRVAFEAEIRNVDRTIGGRLSGALARARAGSEPLPDGTIEGVFRGSAGQSFGAWLAPGITFTLIGDANDYAGKGLSGGVLAIRPSGGPGFVPEENVIAGNTVLYGATSGRAFFRGRVGERFAVRNSGALAVVEGLGDHGCEYMTGGRIVVLGKTGRNFAAGMTGGIAWVLDRDGMFVNRCNRDLVDLEDPTDGDRDELRGLVAEHAARTGSQLAAELITNWDLSVPLFVRVVPRGYRDALEQQDEREEVTA